MLLVSKFGPENAPIKEHERALFSLKKNMTVNSKCGLGDLDYSFQKGM